MYGNTDDDIPISHSATTTSNATTTAQAESNSRMLLLSQEDDDDEVHVPPTRSNDWRPAETLDPRFCVNRDIQTLNEIEMRLSQLRRQVAATVISRAWANRQARHTLNSSYLMTEERQLQAEFNSVESMHQAKVADHQRQLAEASSLQQWDKIPAIALSMQNLSLESEASKALLRPRLTDSAQRIQTKQDALMPYVTTSARLTDVMTAQRTEILRLLEQKKSLCNDIAARAQSLMDATRLSEHPLGLSKPKSVINRPVVIPPVIIPADDDLKKLLTYVAQGKQDEAKTMIEADPSLLLKKGTVTDYSNRTFDNITAFQYALWAYDWRMWEMLLAHLRMLDAREQLHEFEANGTLHGKHYSFDELLKAYQNYIENFNGSSLPKRIEYWCTVIGKLQTQVPTHVAQEYCYVVDSSRHYNGSSFTSDNKGENFGSGYSRWDSGLTRGLSTGSTGKNWYPLTDDYGTLGVDCCFLSYNIVKKRQHVFVRLEDIPSDFLSLVQKDFDALKKLSQARIRQYDELKLKLP